MVRFVQLSNNSSKCIYEFFSSLGESGKIEVSIGGVNIIEAVDFHNVELKSERKQKIEFYAETLINMKFPESYTYATH